MPHSYTRKSKGAKHYRYCVFCRNAQQRGWSRCPSKSLNAHEIETAVAEHIRGIGRNEEILQATVKRVREQSTHKGCPYGVGNSSFPLTFAGPRLGGEAYQS